jgi:hypothetical protein
MQVDPVCGTQQTTTASVVNDAATNSPWSGSEIEGASAYDTATVTGSAGPPSGSVSYDYFTNGTCTAPASSSQVVTVGSDGSVPSSPTEGPLAAGSYSFRATFSGGGPYAGSTGACEPFTVRAGSPGLSLTKTDDLNPGHYTTVGQLVTYTMTATNTGNVTLTNVTVDDSPSLDDFSCTPTAPAASLAPGASIVCTGTHAVSQADLEMGSFSDVASATSTQVGPVTAGDTNAGSQSPAVAIVKTTNGSDGLQIFAGAKVTWKYHVSNTGNVTLHDVTVTDNRLAASAVKCASGTNVIASLAVGASQDCTATGVAVAGHYTNIGTVTALSPAGVQVTAADPSDYHGVTVRIYLGYADGIRTAPNTTPGTPWEGSPNTAFAGCPKDACPDGQGRYEGGAIQILNPSSTPLVLNNAQVTIGHCVFKPWANGLTIPAARGSARGALVLTETTLGLPPQGRQAGCPKVGGPAEEDNFDTSETTPLSCKKQVVNDGLVPQIVLTVNGVKMTLQDTRQILNTGGKDRGCSGGSERTGWTFLATA